ncbi:MAG: hypothetical protein N3I35_13115 [Clostridia bacterium]|nr:hypothetical protein [Clostridia bacterium]
MMVIISILWEWRFVITVAAAFVLFCLLEWQKAKTVLYALMLQAKRLAKDAVLNSGKQQEEWVMEKACQFIPGIKFVPESWLRQGIYLLFHKAKDYLDNGKIDNSI